MAHRRLCGASGKAKTDGPGKDRGQCLEGNKEAWACDGPFSGLLAEAREARLLSHFHLLLWLLHGPRWVTFTENKMTVSATVTIQGAWGMGRGDQDTKDKYEYLPSHAIYFSLTGFYSSSELLKLSSPRNCGISVNARVLCPQTRTCRNTHAHTHGPHKSTLGLFWLLVSPSGFPVTHICLYLIFSRKMFKTGYGKELGWEDCVRSWWKGSRKPPRSFTCPSSFPSLFHSCSSKKKEAENKASRAAGNPWGTFVPVSIFQADVAWRGDRCRAWTVAHTCPLPSWLVPCAPASP